MILKLLFKQSYAIVLFASSEQSPVYATVPPVSPCH